MFILGEHLDLRDAFVHFYRHTQRHIYSSYTHTRTHMYMIVYVCVRRIKVFNWWPKNTLGPPTGRASGRPFICGRNPCRWQSSAW